MRSSTSQSWEAFRRSNSQATSPAASTLDDSFHLVKIIDDDSLPPLSIPITSLTYLNREEEEKNGKQTFHLTNSVMFNGGLGWLKNNPYDTAWPQGEYMSELEVAYATLYRIQNRHKFPLEYVVYDPNKSNAVCGVYSSNFDHFVTAKKEPLIQSDLFVQPITVDEELFSKQRAIIEQLDELLPILKKKNTNTSYWMFNNYVMGNFVSTSGWLLPKVEAFLASDNKFSTTQLKILHTDITSRRTHIDKWPGEDAQSERVLLDNLILKLDTAIKEPVVTNDNVDLLEKFDREIAKSQAAVFKSLITSKSYDHVLTATIDGKTCKTKVGNLKRYRMNRDLTNMLFDRYYGDEDDLHPNQFCVRNDSDPETSGDSMDFDMTKWKTTYYFKPKNYFDVFLRTPRKDTFQKSAEDILTFPIVKTKPYHWPPNATATLSESHLSSVVNTITATAKQKVKESTIDILKFALKKKFADNSYTLQESDVYKKLAQSPIKYYHVFAKALKRLVTPDPLIEAAIKAGMRKKGMDFNPENEVLQGFLKYYQDTFGFKFDPIKSKSPLVYKNLGDFVAEEEIQQKLEFQQMLLSMPEFSEFLSRHGQYAIQCILNDFKADKIYYAQLAQTNAAFAPIAEAIDTHQIEKEYLNIFEQAQRLSNDNNHHEERSYSPRLRRTQEN